MQRAYTIYSREGAWWYTKVWRQWQWAEWVVPKRQALKRFLEQFFFHFVFFYIHNSQLDISIMALHNSGQLVLSVPEDIPPWTGMCHNAEGWVNEKHTICISKPYSLDLFLGSFLAITWTRLYTMLWRHVCYCWMMLVCAFICVRGYNWHCIIS